MSLLLHNYFIMAYTAILMNTFPRIQTVYTCHLHDAYVVKEIALFQELGPWMWHVSKCAIELQQNDQLIVYENSLWKLLFIAVVAEMHCKLVYKNCYIESKENV